MSTTKEFFFPKIFHYLYIYRGVFPASSTQQCNTGSAAPVDPADQLLPSPMRLLSHNSIPVTVPGSGSPATD